DRVLLAALQCEHGIAWFADAHAVSAFVTASTGSSASLEDRHDIARSRIVAGEAVGSGFVGLDRVGHHKTFNGINIGARRSITASAVVTSPQGWGDDQMAVLGVAVDALVVAFLQGPRHVRD